MADSLIKEYALETGEETYSVPAIPYTPAQPAYTYYETQTVCGIYYDGSYNYKKITNPLTGETSYILDTGTGVYRCEDRQVAVNVPATPEIPAEPGYSVTTTGYFNSPNTGWNSGARSAAFIQADGAVQFSVRASATGVIAGMNIDDGNPQAFDGTRLDYGFLAAHGYAKIIENGIQRPGVWVYTDATDFKIERTGTTISFKINGTEVATATDAPTGAAWLEAALYTAGDEVFDPSVTARSSSYASFEPLSTLSTGGLAAYGVSDITFLAMTTAASVNSISEQSFLPLTSMAAGGYSTYGDSQIEFPAMRADASDASLPSSYWGVSSTALQPMDSTATGLTGTIGSASATMEKIIALSADRPTGYASASFPAMYSVATAYEGNNQATLATKAVLLDALAPQSFIVVTMDSAGQFTTTLANGVLVPAEILSAASAGDSWATTSLLHSVLESAGVFSGNVQPPVLGDDNTIGPPSMSDPGTGFKGAVETWVFNVDSQGTTTYTNFYFNSFAQIGNKYYGANSDGIFALEGDTDAGKPIFARLNFGQMDMGTVMRKRVSQAYVGMSAKGNLFMRIEAEDKSYTYKVRSYSPHMQQQRFTFGKGLTANYVWAELFNEDGADFEIDTVEFHVADSTTRRI